MLRRPRRVLARFVVAPSIAMPPGTPEPATCNGQPAAASRNGHDPTYFAHQRPELLALLPETAHAVLDIGCGAGRLGEAIKHRQDAEVIGIELDKVAAAAADAR